MSQIITKKYSPLPTRIPFRNRYQEEYIPRWQNNNSPDDLGIIRFGFELFPRTLKREYKTPDWLRPALFEILKFRPNFSKIDRAHAICTPRDYAKTTWIAKVLPLYLSLVGQFGIYFRGRYILPEADYIRIRGKNEDEAKKKLTNVMVEFSNPVVLTIFGDYKPSFKEIKDEKLKNAGNLVILRNRYIFQAQGINQPSRGANILDRRPKVDINDDVENKENTKTESTRKYNANEILGEQFGGLDHQGLTIIIGNYVHEQCLIAKITKPNSGWKSQFYQATYFDEVGKEKSAWSSRYSVAYIKRLEGWYRNQPDLGGWRTFRMEYYNELVSEKDYVIKWYTGEYYQKDGVNWLTVYEAWVEDEGGKLVKLPEFDKKRTLRVYTVVGVDPAISSGNKASDGAVSAVAFAPREYKYRFVLDVSVAKFDNRDRYYDMNKKPRILAITPEELVNVKRKGLVEETGRMMLKWNANAWVVEKSGQQLAWYNDIKEEILVPLRLDHLPSLPYPAPSQDKDEKLEGCPLNYMAAGYYFFNKLCPQSAVAVGQVKSFNSGKKDVLDTLHNAEQMKEFPTDSHLNTFNKIHIPKEHMSSEEEELERWVAI